MRTAAPKTLNPTVWLALATLILFYGSLAGLAVGVLPLWAAAMLNGLALYAMYSVTHDAIHGIGTPHTLLNGVIGRVCAFHEGMTYPLFKLSHMMHHRHTNHPQWDPDWVIGRRPRWLLPLWVMVRLLHDNQYMLRQGLWRNHRRQLIEHAFTVTLQVAYFFLLATLFGTTTALWLWVVPLAIAGATVELLVAWLVHYPQESQGKYEHTRLIYSRVLQIVMFNHNLHLVHHFWPRTPWFEYPARLPEAERILQAARAPA